VDTWTLSEQQPEAGRRRRRRLHSDEFKADAVAAASQPGMSMASVALARGINANLLRRWVREAEMPPARALANAGRAHRRSVPVQLPEPAAPAGEIRIEVRRGATTVTVAWPMAAACRVRGLDARAAAVIRIEAVWLAVQPLDMRAGTESALARVVNVFGEARPHHAYLFANRRANRMKVLVHDGIGVWLAARRLNSGKFSLAKGGAATAALSRAQFDALVLGLPWQRIGEAGVIRVLYAAQLPNLPMDPTGIGRHDHGL
jgi:transposase